ncbi:POC1 centriolar protein A, partial [Ceratobasidium sp. UAMH 11750]
LNAIHTGWVYSVAYSPDGAYIVSGSDDNTIRIWDAHTGQSVGQPLQGHTSVVSSVAFSPDGAYIVSSSEDQTVRIWDVQSCAEMGGIPESGNTSTQPNIPSRPNADAQRAGPHICNPGCRIDGPHTTWTLDSDGWVVTHESKFLVWIPPDLSVTLLRLENTAIISARGCLQLDFDHRSIGDHWQEHFRPDKSGHAATRVFV